MERGIGTSRGIGIGHVLIVYNASAVVNRGTIRLIKTKKIILIELK